MKFYSEKTNKLYDTINLLEAAEKEKEEKKAKKEEQEQKLAAAYQDMMQAYKKYEKLAYKFYREYGYLEIREQLKDIFF